MAEGMRRGRRERALKATQTTLGRLRGRITLILAGVVGATATALTPDKWSAPAKIATSLGGAVLGLLLGWLVIFTVHFEIAPRQMHAETMALLDELESVEFKLVAVRETGKGTWLDPSTQEALQGPWFMLHIKVAVKERGGEFTARFANVRGAKRLDGEPIAAYAHALGWQGPPTDTCAIGMRGEATLMGVWVFPLCDRVYFWVPATIYSPGKQSTGTPLVRTLRSVVFDVRVVNETHQKALDRTCTIDFTVDGAFEAFVIGDYSPDWTPGG